MSAMPDIFLSYSREDQVVARRFADAFEREGFKVWWDQALNPGEAFDQVTERALADARAVVVLWSPRSVESRWVRAEAAHADERGALVPVQIEPCSIPVKFRLTQTADLFAWQGDQADPRWQSFVTSLRRTVGAPGSGAGAGHASVSAPTAATAGRRMSAGLRNGLIVAAVAVLAGVLWLAFHAGEQVASSTAGSVAQQVQKTMAVLPFADLSEAKDQDYFADGITEEILNSLARISNLQVTGRTSSFYFKGRNENLKTIGETLGVEYLLEGSVRKAGDKLRITAQLIKAADGFHLWSQTYDRDLKDIFGIQEDIARSVADTLQIALGVGELGSREGMTREVQAYESWLQARGFSRQISVEGYTRAADLLEEVVRRDPSFTVAWVDLFYAQLSAATITTSTNESGNARFRRAQEVLPEALEKNPDSRFLHWVLELEGALSTNDWRAAARLRDEGNSRGAVYRSIETSQIATGPAWYLSVDKASAAIVELERRRTQDPLDSGVLTYLSEAYANVGRIEDAIAEYDRSLSRATSELLAMNSVITAYGTGDRGLVEKNWSRALTLVPGAVAQSPYANRYDPAEVVASMRQAMQAQPRVLPASRIALWSMIFGDPKLALQALHEDDNLGRRRVTALALWRPVAKDLRRLPGFKDLMRDWGLVDYWKQYGWGDHCKPVGNDDFECQ